MTTSAAAVTASPGDRWPGRAGTALLVLGGALVVAVLLLQEPVEPFDGLPPAAPEAWRVTGAPLLSALELLLACGLLAAPLAVGSGAARERGARTRARALLLATGAGAPVLVVAVCLLLAVARDPGGVDPSVGSTGFLLALGVGCGAGGLAVRAGVRAGAGAEDRDVPAAVAAARCLAAAVVVLAALATAVVAASLLDGAPRLVGVGAVGLVAAGAVEVWRRASGWAAVLVEAREERATAVARPAEVPVVAPVVVPAAATVRSAAERTQPPVGWSELTPREREVLAELATGASNASIAESLGISPRTVEAHLRSVFVRLGLDPADGSNRRVVAARHWLEHGAPRSGKAPQADLGGSTDAARTAL